MRLMILAAYLLTFPLFSFAKDEAKIEPVKVYCFSADLEAGFEDENATFYCAQLEKRGQKKKSLFVTDKREDAHVIAEYLGTEQFNERGEATYLNYGIAFTPNTSKIRETAIINVGDFSKAFSTDGINAQAAGRLIRQTEAWIRENKETILKKAAEKK